jgi:hypothetical protein
LPEFFIHCGLHKTGTTALQQFFGSNAQVLLDAGLHYPSAGTSTAPGHHNLAWELARDRRFFGRHGNLEMMLRQTAAVGKDTVISSEDFESSLLSPERWTSVVEALRDLGFSVSFVIYLREPASYLRSLFLENIKHGCGDEFSTVARSVVERGSYTLEDWVFQFDYDLIARAMARVPSCKVIFRSFEHLVDGSIVADFFDAIGHIVPPGTKVADTQANVQAGATDLLEQFYSNRRFIFMPPAERVAEIVRLMVGGRNMVPRLPARLTEVIDRQRSSKVKQGLGAPGVAPVSRSPPRPGDWQVNISRLFSWETQVEALAIHERAPGAMTEKVDALRSGDQGVFESWRAWVAAGL